MLTKSEIDKLGNRIVAAGTPDNISKDDLDLLQSYRKIYKEPLSRIFNTLLDIVKKVDRRAIVTYRIKRINTIIRKLQRFCNNNNGPMQLSRMGDIAGCRCILSTNTIEKLYVLKNLIEEEFGPCKEKEYVEKPKKDGYRSIHLYVTDKETGKKIEIQIRNLEQHNWATLVEIVDLLYGTKIKEGQNDRDLKEFLLLFSKKSEIDYNSKLRLLKLESKCKIFKKMSSVFANNYLNVRNQWLSIAGKGNYYVIEASKDYMSEISSYKHFVEAEEEYYSRYLNDRESNIVLTYIQNARFEQISTAYSNYILTVHSFFDDYLSIVSEMIIEAIEKRNYLNLFSLVNCYKTNTCVYFSNNCEEKKELSRCTHQRNTSMKKMNEWRFDLLEEVRKWYSKTDRFVQKCSYKARKDFISLIILSSFFYIIFKKINKIMEK